MSPCDLLRQFLLESLEQDIAAHEKGLYFEVGQSQQNMPDWKACEAEDDAESHRLLIAINFMDSWQDARNHGWHFYPGVEEKDWPILARQIRQGLAEHWEPDEMTDNFVFHPPPPQPRTPLWQRLKSIFQGEA